MIRFIFLVSKGRAEAKNLVAKLTANTFMIPCEKFSHKKISTFPYLFDNGLTIPLESFPCVWLVQL